jgi:hypothetical protein
VRLILCGGLLGLGIFEFIVGHAFGKHGHYARSESPTNYWINTGFHLFIGMAGIVGFGRPLFANRNSSHDDE